MTSESGDADQAENMASGSGDADQAQEEALGDDSVDPSQMLFAAANVGNIDELRRLLELGANVDTQDDGGQSALHYACGKGHVEFVKLMLLHGANPDISNRNEARPLHTACIKGHRECVEVKPVRLPMLAHPLTPTARDRRTTRLTYANIHALPPMVSICFRR